MTLSRANNVMVNLRQQKTNQVVIFLSHSISNSLTTALEGIFLY